jgi:hypothetical protein
LLLLCLLLVCVPLYCHYKLLFWFPTKILFESWKYVCVTLETVWIPLACALLDRTWIFYMEPRRQMLCCSAGESIGRLCCHDWYHRQIGRLCPLCTMVVLLRHRGYKLQAGSIRGQSMGVGLFVGLPLWLAFGKNQKEMHNTSLNHLELSRVYKL